MDKGAGPSIRVRTPQTHTRTVIQLDPIILQRKKQHFRVLRKLFHDLKCKPESIYFPVDELQGFGIQVSPLDLHSGPTATKPGERQFFHPIPASEFRKFPQPPYEAPSLELETSAKWRKKNRIANSRSLNVDIHNHIARELPEEVRTNEHYALRCFTKWKRIFAPGDQNLFGYGGGSHPEELLDWFVGEAYSAMSKEYPHLIISGLVGIEPDASVKGKIARSELLMLVDCMMHVMEIPYLFFHAIYPILVMSIFDGKIRFVQGYFDGEALCIQYSQFLDFTTPNEATFELTLRWVLANPIGDTETPIRDADVKPTNKLLQTAREA
ncbi:hypothetical protein FQN50_003091 [Emmonsiellopsis sp. PD_5]|nr:hypothetical protein FQN50_003091 [Emmonsiellopsis sp. PD_5]